ncbi:hypothetical protein D3C78_1441840 [compost metagenome]
MIQRWSYWYTDNNLTQRCPSGVSHSPNGEYVLYTDAKPFLDQAQVHDRFIKDLQALGYTDIQTVLAVLKERRGEVLEEQIFEVGMEGASFIGEEPTKALMKGVIKAYSFADALQRLHAAEAEEYKQFWNLERGTFFGCKLFDNEAAARQKHG